MSDRIKDWSAWRDAANLSQSQMAGLFGVSLSTVKNWCRGTTQARPRHHESALAFQRGDLHIVTDLDGRNPRFTTDPAVRPGERAHFGGDPKGEAGSALDDVIVMLDALNAREMRAVIEAVRQKVEKEAPELLIEAINICSTPDMELALTRHGHDTSKLEDRKRVVFLMPGDDVDFLDEYARSHQTKRSEVIRALVRSLRSHEGDESMNDD